MSTSRANLDVTQYVKVNAQQGSVTIQSTRDTVRVVFSDVKPARDNDVYHTLGDKDNPLQISDIDTDVWVLAMSDTSNLVITETSSVVNVNVESPNPLPVENVNLDQLITTQGRFKVNNSPRQEQLMVTGDYFTTSLARENRPVDDVPTYIVIDTGDKYNVLEELTVDIDYQNIGDGNVNIKTAFYAMDSNSSDITITGGTPTQLGVPLNMDFVNKVSEAFFRFDATVTINSGDPDFIVFASQYYKDTSGNKETIGGLQAGFFEKGRKIIMSPNKTYVFETIASGVVTGTYDSLTQFSFTEITDPN